MKTFCLVLCLVTAAGGDRERGLQLYREGKFAEAAAAFRAALATDGDSPELQWNLALASWRAGDLAAAETAAEKYAAMDRAARVDLHAGLLGAVRHDEAAAMAKAAEPGAAPPGAQPPDPLPLLEQALAKAEQARDHFVRGATAQPTPELLRNTERTLRLIDELRKKIDEAKQQREQEQKQDESKPDDEQKDDQQEQDKKQQEPKQQENKEEPKEQQEPKPGQGEEKPEPKPEPSPPQDGQPKPEPGKQDQPADGKPEQQQQQPANAEKRQDAPGEVADGKALTPEQTQRLLEQLRELDKRQQTIRARAKTGRRAVERDW